MAQGRKTGIRIVLTPEEKKELESRLRPGAAPEKLARRSRIILLLASGCPILEIARKVNINDKGVYRWAYRFLDKRIDGLADKPKTGRRPADAPPKTWKPFR